MWGKSAILPVRSAVRFSLPLMQFDPTASRRISTCALGFAHEQLVA
jgi:hypothetical protein